MTWNSHTVQSLVPSTQPPGSCTPRPQPRPPVPPRSSPAAGSPRPAAAPAAPAGLPPLDEPAWSAPREVRQAVCVSGMALSLSAASRLLRVLGALVLPGSQSAPGKAAVAASAGGRRAGCRSPLWPMPLWPVCGDARLRSPAGAAAVGLWGHGITDALRNPSRPLAAAGLRRGQRCASWQRRRARSASPCPRAHAAGGASLTAASAHGARRGR